MNLHLAYGHRPMQTKAIGRHWIALLPSLKKLKLKGVGESEKFEKFSSGSGPQSNES